MVQILLIAIGVGAASALLFASLVSGSLLSIFLFYLSPLPVLIAAIGWSHWAALFAAFFAATGLALAFGMFFFIAFLIGVGLPAWWLGYLALLGPPSRHRRRSRLVSAWSSRGVGGVARRAGRGGRAPEFRHR